ncbi:MAG: hypothetical protein ABSF62_00625 [Bryobacteraceae bacterium]|jgi:hypothetical protein
MTKKLLFVTTLLLVVAFVAFAADVTGKWTYEMAGRNGGPGRPTTITLKQDGTKLTGSIPAMMGGRRGGGGGGDTAAPPPDQEISNGKVDGNKIYFEVKRTTQNGDMVTKYEGTLDGDSLKLKITRPAMGGQDAPPPTEVVAKRATT